MKVTEKTKKFIEAYETSCEKAWCQRQASEITRLLLDTLSSPKVVALRYAGTHRINPGSKHIRPVYDIIHEDGRWFKFAFTGLSNLQVLRGRYSKHRHCYSEELSERLTKFVVGN